MDIWVLDTDLKFIKVIDMFKSLIWTTRYSAYGDFELYLPMDNQYMAFLKPDNYLWLPESDRLMIIEDILINSDIEEGNSLVINGRSLESMLTYRIIWEQTTLSGNLQNGIKQLLDDSIITPADTTRKIFNFIFETSTDPKITELTVEAQYNGDDLYKSIQELCAVQEIGFKITLSEANQFVFKLYAGEDRSYSQLANPYVVFSPEFENIINSSYLESKKPFKTVTLVGGEGEGAARKTATVEIAEGGGSGLTRRELFTDASGLSTKVNGGTVPAATYIQQLSEKGLAQLTENRIMKVFEGQVDFSQMFKYGEDFFMGDIVQLMNEYGTESKSRVIELIYSQDPTGLDIYPTFEVKE